MDFLNKAFAQVAELFRSMSPGARITAALLLGVLVVSLAYLFRAQTSGPDTYLLNGHPFPSESLLEVEAAFAKAGLSDYKVEGRQIRVPRRQQTAYIAALADSGAMPQDVGDKLFAALTDASPFTTTSQRKELTKVVLQQELAGTLRQMPSIEAAMVFFDTREKRGFPRRQITTAAVQVTTAGGRALDRGLVNSIRVVVAGAIGLTEPSEVSVVDASTGRAFRGSGPDGPAGAMDDDYFNRKREYEKRYEQQALDLLAYVPGVTVSFDVELDKERTSHEQSTKIDPETVPISISKQSTDSSTTSNDAGGRVGLEAQGNRGAQLSATGKTNESRDNVTSKEENSIASHTSKTIEYVGMTPVKVAASVGVPKSFFEDVHRAMWRTENPDSSDDPPPPTVQQLAQIETDETDKITRALLQFVKSPQGALPESLVSVVPFTTIIGPEIPEPGFMDRAVAWMGDYWSTLGMIGLSLVSLLMLRGMIQAGPQPAAPEGSPAVLPMTGGDEIASEEDSHEARLKRSTGHGPSLRDELADMVREDPEAAANILRTWIGKAG